MTDYTLEIYKVDRRTKAGERLVETIDYTNMSGNAMMDEMKHMRSSKYPSPKYRLDFVETYRAVRNIMNGKIVMERYDQPWCLSVGSETYWQS